MISKNLTKVFLLSLILIYAHGVEEVLTAFQHNDPFIIFGAQYLNTTPEMFYWVSHLIWWISIPLLFTIFRESKFIFTLMALYGIVFIIEPHHIVKALLVRNYYPGMITALFYPIVGFFYWKQLVKAWKKEQ